MANTLTSVQADLSKFIKGVSDDSLKHVAGGAGKKAAIRIGERDTGGDGVLSGFRRRSAKLSAGYELGSGSALTLNLSPKGLWTLMNTGRRIGPGDVYPKKRGGARALNTPWGPRRSVHRSAWSGKGTLADAERAVEIEVFEAVDKEIARRVGGF